MRQRPEDLYLDLMKKTLAFTLWPEPPISIETFNYARSPVKKMLVTFVSRLLRSMRLHLVREMTVKGSQAEQGRLWPGYADTMIGLKRLDNLQFCIETAIRDGIEGDLIETGVWRGGACIFMRAVLAAHGVRDRRVFVADSFAGLPKPDVERFPADKDDKHHTHLFLAVSREDVENNFRKYGLFDEQVVFLKGWFKDTLPKAPMEQLAVLRLDGDMYGSTMEALTNLYPKLARGGFCVVDDYALDGCRKAVDDFRREIGISSEMKDVDWTCRYWRKE
jgi:O-methyltransferase